VDSFPANQQNQIRSQLAMCLQGVISQILLPRADGSGLIPAVEVMKTTPAISALIRNNKTPQIHSAIQTGRTHGMQTRDQALKELVEFGVVEYDSALPYMKDLTSGVRI
jgi:twitching motility protein PilT